MERVATRDSALSPVKMMSHRFVVHGAGVGGAANNCANNINTDEHEASSSTRKLQTQWTTTATSSQTTNTSDKKGQWNDRHGGRWEDCHAHSRVSFRDSEGTRHANNQQTHFNSAVPFICPDCSTSFSRAPLNYFPSVSPQPGTARLIHRLKISLVP